MNFLKSLRLYMSASLLMALPCGKVHANVPDDNGPTFYASMENNDEWTTGQMPSFKRAIYSFTSGGDTFTPCSEINTLYTNNQYYSGLYLDGTFYHVVVPGEGTFMNYTSNFRTMDTDTWTQTGSTSYQNSNMLPFDMTYDYTTQTAYAVSPKGGYSSMFYGTTLNTVDLSTGEFTKVGDETGYMVFALACDGDGQLWGIGTPGDVSKPTLLLKIDKSTGAMTEVGDVGFNLYTASHTSATFDLRTGKLYWTAKTYVEDKESRTYTTALFEVNTTTGNASIARVFANNELMAALFIKDSHPKAPYVVENLRFDFAEGSTTSGRIRFSLPSETYDGTALQGTVTVLISVDGTVTTVEGLLPGSGYESDEDINLTAGTQHKVKVTCLSGSLKGLPSQIDVYGGYDAPAAVGGLTVTGNTRGDKASIRWTAPEKGVNGGLIDTGALTYDIVLKPDNITVAEGLTSTEYEYTFERKMGVSQFIVTPKTGDLTGAAAASGIERLGTPWPVPYLEDFNYTEETYWPFTTIDANGDGDDYIGLKWFFDPSNYCALYYAVPYGGYGNADDWLITPTIDLSTDNVYRLQFDTRGYMGGTNRVVVTTGEQATAESQSRILLDETYLTTEGSRTYSTLFRPEEGNCRIGFHNISDGSDHMYIDNIYVAQYGTTAIPAAPAVEARKTGNSVVLSVTAPALTVAGNDVGTLTALKIYRTTVSAIPLGTIESPAAGETVEWTDTNPYLGECTYIVVATNAEGDGMEATATINTKADVPQTVQDVEVTGKSGWTEAVITWKYPEDGLGANGLPLDASEITYSVSRTIGIYTQVIAENLTACTFTDSKFADTFAEGVQQGYVTYKVTAKTSGGESAAASSKTTLMGRAYSLPFAESWTNQKVDNAPWETANRALYSTWTVASAGYDPMTGGKGQDGYGLATFSISRNASSGKADYVSPRIDVSDFSDVQMSFYLYQSTDNATSTATLQVGFDTEEGGTVMLPQEYRVYGSENGWKQYTVQLPESVAGSNRLSIVFRGYTDSYQGCIHIDNVTLDGSQPEYEVRAMAIKGPGNCLIGNDNIYEVEVSNIGTADNGNISVSLYAGTELTGTKTIDAIAAGQTVTEQFTYSPSLDNNERELTLKAVITADNDESEANNTIELTVALVAPMLPYVNDLHAKSNDNVARLAWSEAAAYPHEESVTDGVEDYEAFSISEAGDWKFVDRDGGITMSGIGAGTTIIQWPNAGEPQSFIVFNPSLAGDGSIDMTQLIAPRSGEQCFICFAARGGNDDWLISPQLSGRAQTVRFYAKTAYTYDLDEKFEVWASQTTADVESFTIISGDKPIVVNSYSDWNKYEYALPEGTKFFAIRCVSYEQTGLMIDDITYSPADTPLQFWGYNVYRDGELITADPIGEPSYTDTDVTTGNEYGYNVTAVYKEGESIFSNHVKVTVSAEPSGIASPTADGVCIIPVERGVRVTNAAGMRIGVYTTDGRTVYDISGTGDDCLPLKTGIYIVRAGSTTAKVSVR